MGNGWEGCVMRAVINTDYRVYSVYCKLGASCSSSASLSRDLGARRSRVPALYNVQRTSRVSCGVSCERCVPVSSRSGAVGVFPFQQTTLATTKTKAEPQRQELDTLQCSDAPRMRCLYLYVPLIVVALCAYAEQAAIVRPLSYLRCARVEVQVLDETVERLRAQILLDHIVSPVGAPSGAPTRGRGELRRQPGRGLRLGAAADSHLS